MKPESNDWSLTMASAFPPRGHDIGHSIWVHDRAVGSIIFLPGPLLAAIVLLATWAALVFGAHIGSGPVQLLYAVAAILFARRIIVGAPKFRS